MHCAITAEGHFVEGLLTGGNVHDVTVADDLFEDVVGCYVVPGRKNRKILIEYDKRIYKLRKRIERFFGKIKENKRVAMRFEKLDETFLGFIALASLKIIINSIIS